MIYLGAIAVMAAGALFYVKKNNVDVKSVMDSARGSIERLFKR